MKKSRLLLICLAAMVAFASCADIVNKAKEKAEKMVAEQAEKAKNEAAKAVEEKAAEPEEAPKQEKKAEKQWWQNDFSISYEFTPMANMKTEGMIHRKGDVVRMVMKLGGTTSDILYRKEGEEVVKYVLNTTNKRAVRSVVTSSIDKCLKDRLSEHIVIPAKDLSKQKDSKKVGTEKIAGRSAVKWVQEKTILTSFSRGTMWLDEEYGFALRTEAYAEIDGKEAMNTVALIVSKISFNSNSADAEIDISNYEIMNK